MQDTLVIKEYLARKTGEQIVITSDDRILDKNVIKTLADRAPNCFTEYAKVTSKEYYCAMLGILNPSYALVKHYNNLNKKEIISGLYRTKFAKISDVPPSYKFFVYHNDTKQTVLASCIVEVSYWGQVIVYEIHEVCVIEENKGICSQFIPKLVTHLLHANGGTMIIKIYCIASHVQACKCYNKISHESIRNFHSTYKNKNITMFVIGSDDNVLQEYLSSGHDDRCNESQVAEVHNDKRQKLQQTIA
jgi:hypothetical protein